MSKQLRSRLTIRVQDFHWDWETCTATFKDPEGNEYLDTCYTSDYDGYGNGDIIEVVYWYLPDHEDIRTVESICAGD